MPALFLKVNRGRQGAKDRLSIKDYGKIDTDYLPIYYLCNSFPDCKAHVYVFQCNM